ncbi:MAG: YigZ family protein [Ruminococcaceae bacterium]|nr:YigZ family protein [Oscillospiraceae bacterium]
MVPNEYRTVKEFNSDEYIVKRSRFIGYAKPVTTVDEANAFIAEIKSKHWDATHNVYAYILRDGGVKRYSDDGEPQGTAGVPVLDVLEKENLVDVCVVVTRYFGGILLGGGGLVRAYSHSAKIGVDSAKIITMAHCLDLAVECDYTFYGKLTDFLSREETVILNTEYTDNVKVIFRIKGENKDNIETKITDLSNGRVSSTIISENFCEF